MWKWLSHVFATLCDPVDYVAHGILQARILGVGNLSLLQGIFPIQGLNPGLPHCRQVLYQLSHKGIPEFRTGVNYVSIRKGNSENQLMTHLSATIWCSLPCFIFWNINIFLKSLPPLFILQWRLFTFLHWINMSFF